jgi:uncharacterized phage protein gp47/JayE
MPFITKNAAQIRTDILRDIKNLLQLSDDKLGPDSDWYVRASSVASVAEGLYQHQGWIVRQIFPDTADSEFLYLHARLRGLSKKAANNASGPHIYRRTGSLSCRRSCVQTRQCFMDNNRRNYYRAGWKSIRKCHVITVRDCG